MNVITLLLLVAALVLFLIAGLFVQGVGKIHFGWLGAACIAILLLLQNV